jgi:predicted porin
MKLIKTTTALVAVAGFLAVAGASSAHAGMEEGVYAALRAGYGLRSAKFNGTDTDFIADEDSISIKTKNAKLKGANFEAALGYQVMPEVRLEGAFSYKLRKGSPKV